MANKKYKLQFDLDNGTKLDAGVLEIPQGDKGDKGDQGVKGDTGATPVISATAKVNAEVGTPSVEVIKGGTNEAPSLSFEFKNLKGVKGDKGDKGDQGERGADGTSIEVKASADNCAKVGDGYIDANGHLQILQTLSPRVFKDAGVIKGDKGDTGATPVVSATATVDNTTGTPSVEVAKGGTSTNPSFAFSFKNMKGEQGEQGLKGDKGETGAKGDKGDPFTIAKTYASVAAMNAGYATDGVAQGSFVLIDTGNVDDEDNAKLYVKGTSAYTYLTDLSGAQGMKGEQGAKGDTGAEGTTFTPSVSSDGVISWTNDGGKANPANVNIKGVKGDTGAKGDTGLASLAYNAVKTTTQVIPVIGSGKAAITETFNLSAFTRTPVVGEKFIFNLGNNNSPYDTFIARGEIVSITDSNVTVKIDNACNITGKTGATGAKGDTGAQGVSVTGATLTLVTE